MCENWLLGKTASQDEVPLWSAFLCAIFGQLGVRQEHKLPIFSRMPCGSVYNCVCLSYILNLAGQFSHLCWQFKSINSHCERCHKKVWWSWELKTLHKHNQMKKTEKEIHILQVAHMEAEMLTQSYKYVYMKIFIWYIYFYIYTILPKVFAHLPDYDIFPI